ncbi:MAG: S41 family peptidase, partial [Acidobacteriaceae bacterium]|nr:S41 family peptidase [Acidobacteriaceae bacterium]
ANVVLLFGSILALIAFAICSFLIAHGGPKHLVWMPPLITSDILSGQELNTNEPVVDAVIDNIKRHYVDREAAGRIAAALETHKQAGDYGAIQDGAALAQLLTEQIRAVSGDAHLVIVYEKEILRTSTGPTPEMLAAYRNAMRESNCTFEKAAVLPHNIGYIKLNSFPDLSVCESTAKAAMESVNRAGNIIFDLRDNRGGYPEMVAFIGSYLFDHPEYWFNPRENTTRLSWTRSPVSGSLLPEKRVFVLTSSRTWSGAEQFAFNLKMLKRATLIGETTRGGAHAGVFHRLDDHFGMGIPEARAINPYSDHDWEGVGVEPDVKVKAEDALKVAIDLASRR